MTMAKRNSKRKLKKGFIIFVLLILLAIIIFITYELLFNDSSKKKNKNIEEEPVPVVKEEHYKATLIAVGDHLIHSSVYKVCQRKDRFGICWKPFSAHCKNIIPDKKQFNMYIRM